MVLSGVSFISWEPNFEIGEPYFWAIFFPESGLIFCCEKNQNSPEITLWRINLSLQKYTFWKHWTKIVGQHWFGTRIYPRGLNLNFRIEILKCTFSLVFAKKIIPIRQTVQKILGDQLVTDNQQIDRQTFLSWPCIP